MLLLILVTGISCTKPFEPEDFTYDRLVVVDGLVTDELKSHAITLSYTFPVGADSLREPITGASVWVIIGDGRRMDFSETGEGHYTSEEFAGIEGLTHQLFFSLPGGVTYQSDEEILWGSPPIDSIYDRYAEIIPTNGDALEQGIQFFLDTHGSDANSRHYRFQWEETFKVIVPSPSEFSYDRDTDTWQERTQDVGTCFVSNASSNIILGNTLGRADNRLSEMDIRFVSQSSDALRSRYSLLVRQFALSAQAFNFYRRLKESNQSGGSLFDTQLGAITGNVSSLTDPAEPVLGYFEVAGISSLRVFFNSSELDVAGGFRPPSFRFLCSADDIEEVSISEIGATIQSSAAPLEIITVVTQLGTAFLGPLTCTRCDWYANPEPPPFWID